MPADISPQDISTVTVAMQTQCTDTNSALEVTEHAQQRLANGTAKASRKSFGTELLFSNTRFLPRQS